MPGTTSDGPTVSLSFANNFWGKEDAGVSPLLERMHNAKVTGDELKAFYTARAQIEEEYARKLLNLARKPLGSSEAGTLRMSLDVIRGEVETMGKAHQQIAGQMKSELEEPLSAFTGGIKERRKIVQNGIEKLLKLKTQQTMTVNKSRDKYEQDCLKIKGYLAQGHMVMGQEERKNKAKLEKTQIQMSATSNEYEAAVKILEETTVRWNREWKAACDKFQDLEEERVDFMKSSLWNFANIASTVCVSDDAACEKIRLSLEDCDVEKDITNFIRESGTGQEIPDAPKFIDFCKDNIPDNASEASTDDAYSVAQFQRTINPAYRTSSPGPKTPLDGPIEPDCAPPRQDPLRSSQNSAPADPYDELPKVPHNEYPMDGMTQFCRIGAPSDRSSIPSPTRPESRDARSEYSNPTSHSSYDPMSGATSPTKQFTAPEEKTVQKRKSGFFQNHSPFRRKSKHENEFKNNPAASTPSTRNGWSASSSPTKQTPNPFNRSLGSTSGRQSRNAHFSASPDPEPVDPRANFQLNVGNNVFDVASPDSPTNFPSPSKLSSRNAPASANPDLDPIAAALAELKGVSKQTSLRVSADRYAGIATPGPGSMSGSGSGDATPRGQDPHAQLQGRTPPPGYDPRPQSRLGNGGAGGPPQSRLGAPQPAFTSKAMQASTASYVNKGRDVYGSSVGSNGRGPSGGYEDRRSQSAMGQRPGTREGMRAASPGPPRATSPRPGMYDGRRGGPPPGSMVRAASPGPGYGGPPPGSMGGPQGRQRANTMSPQKGYQPQQGMRQGDMRARSPGPGFRPGSSNGQGGGMAMQLSQGPPQQGGFGRPTSQVFGEGPYAVASSPGPARPRAGSNAGGGRQVTRDGRPILHFARAMYMYQAAIPEELGFAKGDVLAVVRHQDDGWWEAEVCSKPGRAGLVPSNYLQSV
ncbi:Cell division control protein 15 [Elsinoe australis]|uniref:Cell division control protein 15 n=1 Tax=Elsinoe australis TaxID=40998 RepID=A0A2P8A694_9PEZI|nr:Cell division control protein 15 [Elsinoe australis]